MCWQTIAIGSRSCVPNELVRKRTRCAARSRWGMKWWSRSGILTSFGNTESWAERPKTFVRRTFYNFRHLHEKNIANIWMCTVMFGRHNIYYSSSEESSVSVSGSISTSYSTGKHIRVWACSFSATFFDHTHVMIHIHKVLDHDRPKSVPALALDVIHLGPVRLATRWINSQSWS